ncbi:MAG: glycosyltransferase family 4 protein [Candidatus Dormibacteria bacterium]
MAGTHRRIALIAPPWYPVPPDGYGGTELVVGLLAKELRARGHEVELFAAEGSTLASRHLAGRQWDTALGRSEERLRDLTYASRVLDLIDRLGPFDVIHDHSGGGALLGLAIRPPAPIVHTVHGALDEPLRTYLESLAPHPVQLVAISEAQRQSAAHLPWTATVHNAVDLAALRVGQPERKEPYLLSLARICAAKGQHLAIEAARRADRRLVLAGKIEATPEGSEYYQRHIVPAVDGGRVTYLHNVAGEEKARLLAGASALLAPLQWDEPFGLSIAEAMASGTPVIAFPRGAAPELITPGRTGFLVADVEEMAAAVPDAERVDRERCAAYARARFDPRRMADRYLRVYQRAIAAWATPTGMTASATEPAITWLRGANRRRAQLSLGESEAAGE